MRAIEAPRRRDHGRDETGQAEQNDWGERTPKGHGTLPREIHGRFDAMGAGRVAMAQKKTEAGGEVPAPAARVGVEGSAHPFLLPRIG
jgi:hypothetical protein